MIFGEHFPVPRYTAASKIGNSVISLLWQLRCRCNPAHNKFSSLSNTTVVAIFPKLCFWRRSFCSNLGGIDPEKLYRATLSYLLYNNTSRFSPLGLSCRANLYSTLGLRTRIINWFTVRENDKTSIVLHFFEIERRKQFWNSQRSLQLDSTCMFGAMF